MRFSDKGEQDITDHLADFRARLKTCASGWILLLSIPHLVMLARLKNLVASPGGLGSGGRGRKQKDPNDYMDNLIDDIKSFMKERYAINQNFNKAFLQNVDILFAQLQLQIEI